MVKSRRRLVRDAICAYLAGRPEFTVVGHTGEMAELLRISPRTVENHKRRLYVKLGVESSSQAVSRAMPLGLADLPRSNGRVRVEEPGRSPLVVVLGSAGPSVHRVHRLLVSAGTPVVLGGTRAELSQEHWARWQRGAVLAVLVDPAPGDWRVAASLGARTVVVLSADPDLPAMVDMLLRGTSAIVRGADIDADLAPVLSVVVRGYVAMDAARMDDLTGGVAFRRADGAAQAPALAKRECDVLREIASGRTIRQSARLLGITAKTVENTQARLYRKLGVRNREEALMVAHRLGLLDSASAEPVPGAP